ncbi:MAG: adenosylcobinamide-GDP ribazoletransferase [Kineosporiaceae bacterium]
MRELRAIAGDAARLCLGTLTVLPVGAPRRVDRSRAGVAMAAAPLAGLLVGGAAGAAAGLGSTAGLPGLVVGALTVAAGALATRFLHLDGLADTADGWGAAAHGDRDRALEVMRRGDVGPVGAAVLVLVLLAQAASVGTLAAAHGPGTVLVVAWAWAVSRAAVPLLCTGWFRPARTTGLGALVIGAVPRPVGLGAAAAAAAAGAVLGPVAVAAAVAALAVGAGLGFAARHRLGGLTGDVLGPGVEVPLLVVLAALAAVAPVAPAPVS